MKPTLIGTAIAATLVAITSSMALERRVTVKAIIGWSLLVGYFSLGGVEE